MGKSLKQEAFETIILENFRNEKFDRLTNLKSLLAAYNPPLPQSTGFGSSLYNLYKGSAGWGKHYNTVATNMLNKVNSLRTKKTEEKIDYLLDEELVEIFKEINNSTVNVNPEGHFVALLNAYFNYFPEDRSYLLETSGFHKYVTQIGFDTEYTESYLQDFKFDPTNLFSRGPEVTSLISEMACASFTESELLSIADKVIADNNNKYSLRFIMCVLEKLVINNSDVLKSKIRQFIFDYLMQDDSTEFDQNPIAADILQKTFVVSESGKNELGNTRTQMLTASSTWLLEAKLDSDTSSNQFTMRQFYLLNELVSSANQEECDIIANALLAYIPKSLLTAFLAHTDKSKQYPFYQFNDDEYAHPLFNLLMKLSSKISDQMAARIKAEILKLETYPDKLDFKKTIAGYMLQAFENKTVKPCAEPIEKNEIVPPDFIKEEKVAVSAQTYATHLFRKKPEVNYSDINQIAAHLQNRSNDEKNKEYAADKFIRFGNLMPTQTRMDVLRKVITWPENHIKFNIITKFNEYNKRDNKVNNRPTLTN